MENEELLNEEITSEDESKLFQFVEENPDAAEKITDPRYSYWKSVLIVFFILMDHTDLLYRIAAAVILFLVMIGIKIMGNAMFDRESLGDGDIKLMGVIGLALGLINSFIS